MNFLEYIQFAGNENLEPLNCTAIDHNNHLVTIIFNNNRPDDDNVITSGYRLLNPCEDFEDMTGDIYLGYTTLYRDVDENTVILSNDGSVYVEPEPPEPYVPTEEELQIQFETAKQNKINELSSVCQSTIYEGVDIGEKHYSYTLQDQKNLEDAITIASQTSLEVPYHADGESCSLYSLEKLREIYVSEQINLTQHTTYFNQIKQYIVDTFTDRTMIDDLQNITYGTELTGSYLDTYNAIMEQSMVIMNALGES